MKKLFTLTAVLLISSMATFAQTVRKTWDFRDGWSATTIANLAAAMEQNGATGNDSHWRNYEKDATAAGDPAYWRAANGSSVNSDGNAITTVDGNEIVISELEDLNVTGIKAKGFVICYNYSQSENESSPSGMYPYGNSFVWLNGSSLKFTFTALKGDTLRMGLESHKNSEARGLNIAVDGETIAPIDGNNTPTFYEDVTWVLPDDTPGVDDYTTVTVTTTNGCHIYYIISGKGDATGSNLTNVSYIYSGTTDGDVAYATLTANEDLSVTAIDASTTTLTTDQLIGYDVNVVSPDLPADNANVAVLKDAMPWTPMLNFNGNLYAAWGYGELAEGASNFGATSSASSKLFTDITLVSAEDAGLADGQSGIVFTNGTAVSGVKLGEYFADDDILATDISDASIVAIHAHNISHNGYLYLPYSAAALADAYQDNDQTTTMINNAVSMLASSKADLSANAAPTFSMAYGNFQTTVTISNSRSDAAIYYTTDGTDPTTSSTLYTEPFTVTEETTVKAIAQSEGYYASAVAETVVPIYEQAKGVTISVSEEDDASTLTLTTETEDGVIWYNFSASTDTTSSSKYTEPIVVRDHKTITAFVTSQLYVQSEPTVKEILVKNDKVYIDVASHFDANYSSVISNNTGFFSWGKSASDETVTTDSIIGTYFDEDGIEQIQYYSYVRDDEVYVGHEGDEWCIKSKGQSVLWQNLSVGTNVGDVSAYNPATADDVDDRITKYDVQFYKFISGQYNARIESTVKFQLPFTILTFLGNANSDTSVQRYTIDISTDGETWETADSIEVSVLKRLWAKYERLIEGTDEVYVRLAQVSGNSSGQCYDIYVLTEGEESLKREAELAEAYSTGISNVSSAAAKAEPTAIYNLCGHRIGAMQKGVNIVKMSDGTTRKVLVK